MTAKEKAQAHLDKILGMTDPEAIEGAIGEAAKDLGIGKPSAEHTVNICAPFVATLPTGERVMLPAGTVLREEATEAVGMPRELAPTPGVDGPAAVPGRDGGTWVRTKSGEYRFEGRLTHDTPCSLAAFAPIAEASPGVDPWLDALTLAAYNATRSGLARSVDAKTGIAALMRACTAGVERAIADHAKASAPPNAAK